MDDAKMPYYTFAVLSYGSHWKVVALSSASKEYIIVARQISNIFNVEAGWLKTQAIKNHDAILNNNDDLVWETKDSAEKATKEFFEALYLAKVMSKK